MANVLYYRYRKNSLNQAKSTLNRVLRYGMLLDFFISAFWSGKINFFLNVIDGKNFVFPFSFYHGLFIYSGE